MRWWTLVALGLLAFAGIAFTEPLESGNDLQASFVCKSCQTMVKTFQFIYGAKFTQDQVMRLLVFICKTFAHTDSTVCRGMGGQFRDELLYVIRELIFEPQQLCGLITSNCGESYNPFRANWTVPLPPKPSRALPDTAYPRSVPKALKVLQISDLHFDLAYKPGAEASCGLPICCHHARPVTTQPAGYWGTLAACDLPHWTIENMFQHLNATQDDFDYILLSGDYMSHNDWTYTRTEHMAIIDRLTNLFETYLPEKPVFWALGNHEGVPVNSFAPHFAPERFQPGWLYKSVSRADRAWLDEEAQQTMEYRGSYNVGLGRNLRLISLNTGYCETTNFWLYINQTDPDGTMSWFVEQLKHAEESHQFVHVMAHVPPGDAECLEGWAYNYYRVVNRFSTTITAQFFGHVHTDSFTVFYENMDDPSSKPTGLLYSAPSVTTYAGMNPAYRIYSIEGDFEGSRYRVLDYDNYFLNLSKLHSEADKPKWEKLYSARSEYDLRDLSPESWNDLIPKIHGDEETYKRFLKNYVRRDDFEPLCDAKCRAELLCALRRGHHSKSLCPDGSSALHGSKIGEHIPYSKPKAAVEPRKFSFLEDVKSKAISKIVSLFSN